jgi:hypothetical protein
MGHFESSVKPAPPAPGPKTERLTTKEEECGGVNASFAAHLQHVAPKGSPKRFEEHLRNEHGRSDGYELTEEDLDRFLRSLDHKLVPTSVGDDRVIRRHWRQFWSVRTTAWTSVLERIKSERKKKKDETRDYANIERAIVRSFLRIDRQHLRAFVGKKNVDVDELALALWRSHSESWSKLAAEPSVLVAIGKLPEAMLSLEGFERANTNPFDSRPHLPAGGSSPARPVLSRMPSVPHGRPPDRSLSTARAMRPHELIAGQKK